MLKKEFNKNHKGCAFAVAMMFGADCYHLFTM